MNSDWIVYRRARFTARFPPELRYTRAHYWLREGEPLRIGLTPFATRMLGEVAYVEFAVDPDEQIELGETVGTVE